MSWLKHCITIKDKINDKCGLSKHNFELICFCMQCIVEGQSKEAITQITEEVCTQAGMEVETFIDDIGGLCESLALIAKYCCEYQDIEDTKITSLVEHCFICANEMLNFQHNQCMSHTCMLL